MPCHVHVARCTNPCNSVHSPSINEKIRKLCIFVKKCEWQQQPRPGATWWGTSGGCLRGGRDEAGPDRQRRQVRAPRGVGVGVGVGWNGAVAHESTCRCQPPQGALPRGCRHPCRPRGAAGARFRGCFWTFVSSRDKNILFLKEKLPWSRRGKNDSRHATAALPSANGARCRSAGIRRKGRRPASAECAPRRVQR